MVLHADLGHRGPRGTRDVDYVRRAFVAEYAARGCLDAGERLDGAIQAVASKFALGRDWMNAGPDVALPMALDPRTHRQYDPIATAALHTDRDRDLARRTLFSAPGLRLIAITWPWALALKLARYAAADAADARAIVRLLYWRYAREPRRLEECIVDACWPMGYQRPGALGLMRARLRDAVWRATCEP
ncbi:hypothetical protein K488DRAFT_91179 [Vararia minispora EC-137]|uniref:Uncharacterized protein n=1 Tax=Vararia minispora EC-137 TaxID=1314806 RepID=A0ACB8Q6R3_9AGAM|nr:hypothetical protein K488DRAFT_91179 [Vararia minispora EC-137]